MASAGKVSPITKGKWTSLESYTRLDIVTNETETKSYIAKKDSINVPLENTEYWQPFVDLVGNANDVSYDNTTSGMTATTVQDAIDELADRKIDIDDTMSDTSTNVVQNKVIKKYADDIDNKYSQLSNPNLLLDSDFRVNQRQGKIIMVGIPMYNDPECTSFAFNSDYVVAVHLYSNGNYYYPYNGVNYYIKASDVVDGYVGDWIYTVDRWKKVFGIVEILDDGIKINKNGNPQGALLFQRMENPQNIYGKTITISARINNEIVSATGDIPLVPPTVATTLFSALKDNVFFRVAMQVDGNLDFTLGLFGGTTDICTISWAKAELGSIATPYEHPDYGSELAKCQYRYRLLGAVGQCIILGTTAYLICDVPLDTMANGNKNISLKPHDKNVAFNCREINANRYFNATLTGIDINNNCLTILSFTDATGFVEGKMFEVRLQIDAEL